MKMAKYIFIISIIISIPSYGDDFSKIMKEIKKDISYSRQEVKKNKELFQEQYKTIGAPGIEKLRFKDLTVHERIIGWPANDEAMIVSTNSARVTGEWNYTKPHVYLIEKINSKWKIILKQEITSYQSALYMSCETNDLGLFLCTDNSVQFFKPKEYGRSPVYVFQIYHQGLSDISWSFVILGYDWYGKKFTLSTEVLPFPIIPSPPTN